MVGGIYQARFREAAEGDAGGCEARDGAFLLEGFPEAWRIFATSEPAPPVGGEGGYVYWEVTAAVPGGVVREDFDHVWKACLNSFSVAIEAQVVHFGGDEEENALCRCEHIAGRTGVVHTGAVEMLREARSNGRQQERNSVCVRKAALPRDILHAACLWE
jgi:hypothetical protein